MLAVKIDNHRLARPQSGIDIADAVIELPVESGLTRFIALFHSVDAEYVGPVRSGRPTDPTLLRPLDATFLISGAQPWVISVIRNHGVGLIGDIREGVTYRIGSRNAPHNLYADTTEARAEADRRGYDDDPPPEWFPRGDVDLDGAPEASEIELDWSAETTSTWVWDGTDYRRRTNGEVHLTVTRDGEESQITADVLLVMKADRYTSRPAGEGTPVPALETTGSGPAWLFADGHVVEGRWERGEVTELPRLVDEDGTELIVPPGRIWMSWLPTSRTVTITP